MTSDSRLRRNPQWLSAWVGSELMMMHGERGEYISASQSGGRIWELLEEPRTLDDLLRALEQEYAGDPALIRQESQAFVESMVQEGIVHVEEV